MATLTSHVTVVPPGVFFCNGMKTTKESANALAKQLAGIIHQRVHLHYNGATGPDETAVIGTLAALSVVAGGSSFLIENKGKRALAGTAAVIFAMAALAYYLHIQGEKDAEGERLAERVIEYLDQDPRAHVVLVLHSQGADVGNRALKYHLGDYKDRIEVVTVGPAVQIPPGRAHKIKEIQNSDDWISRVAVAFNSLKSSTQKASITRVSAKCADWTCHGLGDSYLGNSRTARAVKKSVQPRCFTGFQRVSCGDLRLL